MSLVDSFCLTGLAHTCILTAGGAIPNNKYKALTLVVYKNYVTDRHASFSSGYKFFACVELVQTGVIYTDVVKPNT